MNESCRVWRTVLRLAVIISMVFLAAACVPGGGGDGDGGWNVDFGSETNGSADAFTSIYAGYQFTCGIRESGEAVCWGSDHEGKAGPPEGSYKQLALGRVHGCGILEDDSVVCWGSERFGRTDAPVGRFVDISVSKNHSCGLTTVGNAVCWGLGSDPDVNEGDDSALEYDYDQSVAPDGQFIDVATVVNASCGITPEGDMTCWGHSRFDFPPNETAPFGSLTGYDDNFCALGEDKAVTCTGLDTPSATYIDVATGDGFACAILEDGGIDCWASEYGLGLESLGIAPVPEGAFIQIAAGEDHACALDANGRATCWGNNNRGQIVVPGQTDSSDADAPEELCEAACENAMDRCAPEENASQSDRERCLGDCLEYGAEARVECIAEATTCADIQECT